MKKMMLTTALVTTMSMASAHADILTIGFQDSSTGNTVQTIASAPGTTIQLLGDPFFLGSGFGFDQITALLIPPSQSGLGGTVPTFEFAFNNGFVPPQGGTIRLYATWQGATTQGGAITLPSIFLTNEMPVGMNGLFVAEQIFVCPVTGVFCDNNIVGGGTLVGSTTITDQLLTTFPTFIGVAPGQPFAITEQFTFGQDRCCIAGLPQGDVGAAILTTPIGPAAVPGPVVGAGLPGLLMLVGGWILGRKRRMG